MLLYHNNMKSFVLYTKTSNPFFYNLTRALRYLGHTVYLLNPSPHVAKIFQEECSVVRCSEESLGNFFQENDIDSILLWNGSNNLFIVNLARDNDIKTWFFENGYLPNTLQMNRLGVNASVGYNTNSVKELYSFTFPDADIKINNFVIKQPKRLTILSYLMSKLSQARHRNVATDIYRVLSARLLKLVIKIKYNYGYSSPSISYIGKPYIFFPLQVNDDTQIIQNSSYQDMYQILDTLAPLISNSGYQLVIKEHPEDMSYTKYKKYTKFKNVHLTKNVNINNLIENADCILTVNSSVGFQAIQKHKKVITFGASFYNSAPGVYQCNLYTGNFLKTLSHVIGFDFSSEEQDKYINHFKDNIFIEGNWKEPDTLLLEGCVKRLLSEEYLWKTL